jgi:hypothetical protein
MKKISLEEYERLKKASKGVILEALLPFVAKPKGKKPEGERALTGYERLKRYRQKIKGQ